ncbi:hypothetical protein LSUCC1028_03960 [Rhodobacterales bacterium LSUCC1028]|nr:hypothetical protein [Rhodobacterales bacterium LSUCC1028]
MERAIDKYVNEVGPMLEAKTPIHPQIITTRAATCEYVDNRGAITVYEQNIRMAENRRRQVIADLEHNQRQRKLRQFEDAEEVE